jgi:hypothetical protein
MGILVRATQRGFYDTLREPGDVFEIRSEKDFAPAAESFHLYGDQAAAPVSGWMERVEGDVAPGSGPQRTPEPHEPVAFSTIQKAGGKGNDPFTRAAKPQAQQPSRPQQGI